MPGISRVSRDLRAAHVERAILQAKLRFGEFGVSCRPAAYALIEMFVWAEFFDLSGFLGPTEVNVETRDHLKRLVADLPYMAEESLRLRTGESLAYDDMTSMAKFYMEFFRFAVAAVAEAREGQLRRDASPERKEEFDSLAFLRGAFELYLSKMSALLDKSQRAQLFPGNEARSDLLMTDAGAWAGYECAKSIATDPNGERTLERAGAPGYVFVSYDREERLVAERLAGSLRRLLFRVWFDEGISVGADFSEEIEKRLNWAEAVVVCWSPQSVCSDWVNKEARVGFEKQILLPVMVERCELPEEFRASHYANLCDWQGDQYHREWRSIVSGLSRLTERYGVPHWLKLTEQGCFDRMGAQSWCAAYPRDPLARRVREFLLCKEERRSYDVKDFYSFVDSDVSRPQDFHTNLIEKFKVDGAHFSITKGERDW